jgi:hypothetical protein
MEIVFGILFLLIATGVVYMLTQGERSGVADIPQTPETIVIAPEWTRLTIRAERDTMPEKPWVNVRVQASIDQNPVQTWMFTQWSAEQMQAFEDRLVAAGWSRHAQGSSDQLPEGFVRLDRFVIFTKTA